MHIRAWWSPVGGKGGKWWAVRSRVAAADARGLRDALDRDRVRREARRDAIGSRALPDRLRRLEELAPEPVLDLGLGPGESRAVLRPLEVADDHAAGVAQDVGDHGDAIR